LAEGLVVAGGVDGEFAEEFAGGGVDDADVEVVDQLQDGGSGVFGLGARPVRPADSVRYVLRDLSGMS
jgi:hypothetical protein